MKQVIQTARLLLRQLHDDDAKALFIIWSNDDVTRHMNIQPFSTEAEALHMIRLINDLPTAFRYAVIYEGETVGSAGFNHVAADFSYVEIGYELSHKMWRQGFGTEIIQALIHEATRAGYQAMHAKIDPDNIASVKLVEKLGFYYKDHQIEEGAAVLRYELVLH